MFHLTVYMTVVAFECVSLHAASKANNGGTRTDHRELMILVAEPSGVASGLDRCAVVSLRTPPASIRGILFLSFKNYS